MSFGVPLGIAGIGLIGGSIALRARARGIETLGYDPDPSARSLVSQAVGSLEELAARAATLVLAMPLDATLAAIETLRAGRTDVHASLVLDVASVKAPVAKRAAGWQRFVPTHPIAGAERGGAGAARADLFVDRAWAFVPTSAARDAQTRSFIEAMGARPIPIEAEAHDRALALTSHLPQVVVAALAAMLEEEGAPPGLAGPGLASTIRLAGSPWQLWETIVQANAPALSTALRTLGGRLSAMADDLAEGDVRRMASYFEGARAAYDKFTRSRPDGSDD